MKGKKPKVKGATRPKKTKPIALSLVGERVGTKIKVSAFYDERLVQDTIEFDRGAQRERFVKRVHDRAPGAGPAAVEADLLSLPATLPSTKGPAAESAAEECRGSVKVVLTFLPNPGSQTGTLTADRDGAAAYLDTIDPRSAAHRNRFISALAEKVPVLDLVDTERQLIDIAEQRVLDAQTEPTAVQPAADRADDLLAAMPEDIRREAEAFLKEPELIQRVVDDIEALGVAGERELTMTIYLIGVSRLLPRPLAGIVQGPSASGKSHFDRTNGNAFPA